ncbi:unnamed protein product [Hymenolepis diminuta]|nr:unnamed protein product [Hymenolepis diminuta]
MTEFQRLMLNDPQAALAHRQRIEEEQRRMAAMAAMHYNAVAAASTAGGGGGGGGGGNRLPYASINPSPLGVIDSMFTTLPANVANYAPRPPMFQQQRDTLSESYNAVQNMLLSRFPMLARAPGALHDMSVRLFLNNMANTMASQSANNAHFGLTPQPQQSTLASLMTNPHRPTPPHLLTSLSQSNFSNMNASASAGNRDVGNNISRLGSPMIVDLDNESPVEDA